MILSTVLSFARTQALTDSNGLTDARGIIFGNAGLNDLHRQLVKAGVDASQIQETYIDGVVPAAGNGSTLLYPSDCLALKTIELNYTDTNAKNYKLATQVDIANLPGRSSFSWLRGNANIASPEFDDRGDWYEIFPAFTSANNLTNAIRMFYFLKPTQYTSTSDTVAYPENKDESLLGTYITARYLKSLGTARMADGEVFMKEYQQQVKDYINTLARGSQQPVQATGLQIDGYEF